jgi:transcriptional regulator with XRE-family HTH domain
MKKRLIELMRQHNLSDEDLAVCTGIPKLDINSWLKTTKMPDYFQLLKLSEFFEVTLDYLCERIDEIKVLDEAVGRIQQERLEKQVETLSKSLAKAKKTIGEFQSEQRFSSDEIKLFEKYRGLSEHFRRQAKRFIETLAEREGIGRGLLPEAAGEPGGEDEA